MYNFKNKKLQNLNEALESISPSLVEISICGKQEELHFCIPLTNECDELIDYISISINEKSETPITASLFLEDNEKLINHLQKMLNKYKEM